LEIPTIYPAEDLALREWMQSIVEVLNEVWFDLNAPGVIKTEPESWKKRDTTLQTQRELLFDKSKKAKSQQKHCKRVAKLAAKRLLK
jgi:hypothetical protein